MRRSFFLEVKAQLPISRCVGWVEQSETQQMQVFKVLGCVPQPDPHL